MRNLDGPRLEPRTAPNALVVLLHGYGANGDDLIALGEVWRERLPDAVFVAPNAPEEIPGMYGGLQWFPLTMRDPGEYGRGVAAVQPLLDQFLDAELQRYRVSPDRLVLVGFSQGCMIALHIGLRRSTPPAAVIGLSGLLAGPEHLLTIKVRPPILLIHGEADDLIPVDAMHIARELLANAGLLIEWHVRPNLGHGIDEIAQHQAAHFIQSALRGRQSAVVS
jgi:phospholipase/carboxylesterase